MLDRSRPLNNIVIQKGPILYWMNREQRAEDNWALLAAQSIAQQQDQPVLVVFCLQSSFLKASPRHFSFMHQGLIETAVALENYRIPFVMTEGDPGEILPELAAELRAGAVVCDFSPLRIPRNWRDQVAQKTQDQNCALIEVDGHNIVPVWQSSNKQEYSARTIRPKINRQLKAWLTEFPALLPQDAKFSESQQAVLRKFGWKGWDASSDHPLAAEINAKISVLGGVDTRLVPSGSAAALQGMRSFIKDSLANYEERNDPNQKVTSGLSAYLHFGQISAQRIALEVVRSTGVIPGDPAAEGPAAEFLEELIVRRELADNFCFYNPFYDSFEGFPNWANKTLNAHRSDPRSWRYRDEQLALGKTHDDLWNAAQQELVANGSMPGYLRMYWAKKILEWTASPEQAMQIAIDLNDTYALDGRDPNGYTGIAWSIGGVHDRPWGERAVFGNIRFMSYDGCKKKFSISEYINSAKQQTNKVEGMKQLSFELS